MGWVITLEGTLENDDNYVFNSDGFKILLLD